jgi:hypothetical protein
MIGWFYAAARRFASRVCGPDSTLDGTRGRQIPGRG